MKYIFQECGSKQATIRVTMDAGSAVEFGGKWTSGIAHFMEHMMFQGSKSLTHEELVKAVATLGARWNAATWHDKVAFYIIVPAENASEAAKLLGDMLLDRKFDDEEMFEKEKLVILEEEREGKDDLDSSIMDNLCEFICKGPIAVPIIGTSKSIKSIGLEELNDFYNTFYKPANMLVTVTGPKSLDNKYIAECFGGDTGRMKRFPTEKNEFTNFKRRTKRDSRIMQQAKIFVVYKAFQSNDKRFVSLNLASKFFAEGMDSRLFQTLRQKNGLCYGVGPFVELERDIGWYMIWTSTAVENVQKTLKLIYKEVENLVENGPTDEEMLRAKNKYISQYYAQMETSSGLNSIVTNKAHAGGQNIEKTITSIKSMTKGKVDKTCKDIFNINNRQVFVCLPEGE